MILSEGTLLNGRVRYAQPQSGFRSGIEPILLAASVPARSGERVLEGGSGAGAGLLCLGARVPGVFGVGIERDPGLATLANANSRANDFPLKLVTADVLALPLGAAFDHVFANPPYHGATGTPSPDTARGEAKSAPAGLIADWTRSLGAALRPGGTLTLILPPSRLEEALAGWETVSRGGARLFPLWPRAGSPAKLLLLRAVRGSRAPLAVLPGLVLHSRDGKFTQEADACLRDGAALTI